MNYFSVVQTEGHEKRLYKYPLKLCKLPRMSNTYVDRRDPVHRPSALSGGNTLTGPLLVVTLTGMGHGALALILVEGYAERDCQNFPRCRVRREQSCLLQTRKDTRRILGPFYNRRSGIQAPEIET
jgi:hypothetical protein